MKTTLIKDTVVPVLGLGTWRLYGVECTKIVNEALAMGYRHVDTAQFYENEFQVGDALKKSSGKRERYTYWNKQLFRRASSKRLV